MRAISRRLIQMMAIAAITLIPALSAQAATGYWKFSSYATKPSQDYLDGVVLNQHKLAPDRTFEETVTGAFQPAESGAGTLDIDFKTDNVDRQVYLTSIKFSFTTGVDMLTLSPHQKLQFHGVLTVGGNALAKSIPAKGSGMMAVDNGDYFLSTEAPIDQTGSHDGVFEVPSGGPGSTMMIYVAGSASSYGALNGRLELYYSWVEGTPPASGNSAPPPPPPPPPPARPAFTSDSLGSRLDVDELDGLWKGVWTRRPGTDVFDAEWHSAQYPEVHDVIRLESISGNKIVFTRDGNAGRYYGTFSADGSTISGTASWYTSGMRWSARVGGP